MHSLKTLLLVLFPLFSFAQIGSIEREIETIAQHHLQKDKIVGLSIGIVKDNEVLFCKGYGSKKVGTQQPVDSLTNFVTASISKLFTATAIMQLHEQGKIDLNEKLTKYVPEFKMKDARYKDITIYQLLTHTAGVNNYFKRHFIRPAHDSVALTEFAHKLKNKKLRYKPGVALSKNTYSNSGYNLLGLVIERVSGQTYADYMNEHVLWPVGMKYSSFFIDSIDANRRSTPHKKNWLTGKIKASNYYPDIPQDKPCGNLNSCSADLCKWMIHNLSIYNSQSNDKGIIDYTSQKEMWTTKEKIEGHNTSIGLGWWIVDSKKYGQYLFHVGNDPGYSANLILSPKNNFGIIVMCNGMYPMNEVWNEVPFEIIDLFKSEWKN